MNFNTPNHLIFVMQSLLSLPRFFKKTIALTFDIFLCLLALWFAFSLSLETPPFFLESLTIPATVALLIAIPIFILFNLYSGVFRYAGSKAFASIIRAVGIFGALYALIFALIGVQGVPRSIGILQPAILVLMIGGSRFLVSSIFMPIQRKTVIKDGVPSVLIYGSGVSGRQLAISLSNAVDWKFVGYLSDDSNSWGGKIDGYPVFNPILVEEVIKVNSVSEVWLALPSPNPNRRLEVIKSVRKLGVHVRSIPAFHDVASGKVRVSDVKELDVNDLLNRATVEPNISMLRGNIFGKVVLVTGAGGTIGSELCRQIIRLKPVKLIMVDHSEHALYLIHHELVEWLNRDQFFNVTELINLSGKNLLPILASVTDEITLSRIFKTWKPHTVFHAAAFKHVGLVEQNISVALNNNIWGTYNCTKLALAHATETFVLVSTDKAVRPTNVMGASKRLAELIVQGFAVEGSKYGKKFSSVRFGNVLGSSGSVLPLFRDQISKGGPVTVTHLDVTRYFMTVNEAAELVIQAGSMGRGGEVFVLDMGNPVSIYEFARRVIEYSGHSVRDDMNPSGDITIEEIGLKPGEKLHEELLIRDNPEPTLHPKIMKLSEDFMPLDQLEERLDLLRPLLNENNIVAIRQLLVDIIHEYTPARTIIDLEWNSINSTNM